MVSTSVCNPAIMPRLHLLLRQLKQQLRLLVRSPPPLHQLPLPHRYICNRRHLPLSMFRHRHRFTRMTRIILLPILPILTPILIIHRSTSIHGLVESVLGLALAGMGMATGTGIEKLCVLRGLEFFIAVGTQNAGRAGFATVTPVMAPAAFTQIAGVGVIAN